MLTTAVLEKLQTFDTPTICNIIELFDVRPRTSGYMDGRIRAAFAEMPPAVGFAATATFRANAPRRNGDVYTGLVEQVERFHELAGPAFVVFQDLDDPTVAATFGEVMCTTYKTFGAVGLITSGAGRDLEQVRALDFPVFTNGTICSHGYDQTLQVHVPVHVGGLTVYPNDLLHGDCNGVTTIPIEIAAEAADVGDEFVEAETVYMELLRQGEPSVKRLAEAQAEKKIRIDRLQERVSRRR